MKQECASRGSVVLLILIYLGGSIFAAHGADSPPPAVNNGDNAWLLTSTALVLMMTAPGLILFYGGLVRRKNVLATMMHSMAALAVVGVYWIAIGYSLTDRSSVGANRVCGPGDRCRRDLHARLHRRARGPEVDRMID